MGSLQRIRKRQALGGALHAFPHASDSVRGTVPRGLAPASPVFARAPDKVCPPHAHTIR